jgi:hypothetical protein
LVVSVVIRGCLGGDTFYAGSEGRADLIEGPGIGPAELACLAVRSVALGGFVGGWEHRDTTLIEDGWK